MASSPVLLAALVRPKTSAALREKVMLGVTSVTDCRYCQWGHTHWAMAHGVPLEEVNQILGHQIESLEAKNPAEAAAILFAQHYAEHLDRFDPESIENLRKHYSDAQVAEILAYVRAITLGSLTGNTVDAFLDRFRRHSRTSAFFEGLAAAAAAPVVRLLTLLAKVDRRVSMGKTRSRWHRPRRDGQEVQRGTVDGDTSATLPRATAIRLDSGGPAGAQGAEYERDCPVGKPHQSRKRHEMSAWKRWITAACFALGVSTLLTTAPMDAQAQAPAVDPAAVEKLKRMTEFLDGLKQFSLQTQNVIEELHGSGHRVDKDLVANVTVKRPNKLRAVRAWRTPGPALLL